jgi:hypothetical protein
MSEIGTQADRDTLRAVVNGASAGIPLASLIANSHVSNAIVRQLDALGLDGMWFSFGPYRGWRIGPMANNWTVLEWGDNGYALASTATGFLGAIGFMLDGKRAELEALWLEASQRQVQ